MANIWFGFQKLIDKDIVTVGEVDSVDASTGTSVVVLLSGDYLKVLGSATIGNKVLIKDGAIIQDIGVLAQYNEMLT